MAVIRALRRRPTVDVAQCRVAPALSPGVVQAVLVGACGCERAAFLKKAATLRYSGPVCICNPSTSRRFRFAGEFDDGRPVFRELAPTAPTGGAA